MPYFSWLNPACQSSKLLLLEFPARLHEMAFHTAETTLNTFIFPHFITRLQPIPHRSTECTPWSSLCVCVIDLYLCIDFCDKSYDIFMTKQRVGLKFLLTLFTGKLHIKTSKSKWNLYFLYFWIFNQVTICLWCLVCSSVCLGIIPL